MVMDLYIAEAFGLHMLHIVNGNCGQYVVLGSGLEHEYAGVVEQLHFKAG